MASVIRPIRRQAGSATDTMDKYLQLLPDGHLVHTLFSEHRVILDILNQLEICRKNVWNLQGPLEQPEIIMELVHTVEKLVSMRVHHIRENETIFLELGKLGMHKYHHVLESEHRFLKEYKDNFLIFLQNLGETDFTSFKHQMNFQANGIIGLMREHIFIENKNVFPLALEIIQDPGKWADMKTKSDALGYSLYKPPPSNTPQISS